MAPGPEGSLVFGHVDAFRRDVLRLLVEAPRQFGDVVRFRLGPHLVHLLNHPDHVRQVLQEEHGMFDKRTRSVSWIRLTSGESLLTANEDAWLWRRRLIQPVFQQRHVAGFGCIIENECRRMIESWREHAAGGRAFDVASEMMRLTFSVVAKALFGADLGTASAQVEQALAVVLEHTYAGVESVISLPLFVPTKRNLKFRRARAALDRVVNELIEARRRSFDVVRRSNGEVNEDEPQDLLARMLMARDATTGEAMTDTQLRDEIITLLLAGHETTANALAWTFYLLSQHPVVEERVETEAHKLDVTEGISAAAMSDRLSYTRAVIQESMRLYPPIWAIERRAVATCSIGGFRIPKGSTVVISPYALHRNPAFWERPDAFDPDRFINGSMSERPSLAYIPFGAGPRQCIGMHFAMLEAVMIVTLTLRTYRLRFVPGSSVEPSPGITMRIKNGLWMTAEPHRPDGSAHETHESEP